ncbi:hypothetical protein DLJ82_5471 (plasmid) [Rhizobium leguminosarum]|uniref:Uncharacterized protein n=1 Tax=Rhizobium leguminosarum TaxID=384 RepID=A0A2Z4YRL4_RHILE|nr:hypothetical protein DLJ82_5471 [Rhizobium leguminosarum]
MYRDGVRGCISPPIATAARKRSKERTVGCRDLEICQHVFDDLRTMADVPRNSEEAERIAAIVVDLYRQGDSAQVSLPLEGSTAAIAYRLGILTSVRSMLVSRLHSEPISPICSKFAEHLGRKEGAISPLSSSRTASSSPISASSGSGGPPAPPKDSAFRSARSRRRHLLVSESVDLGLQIRQLAADALARGRGQARTQAGASTGRLETLPKPLPRYAVIAADQHRLGRRASVTF